MLVPAISRKNELEQLFAEHLYDDEMFLYNGYAYANKIPDLTPAENIFRWAIINQNNEVIGYFSYFIETQSDNVCSFGLFSFKRDSTIGIDVYKKIKELVKTHHRVEWRMIGGNPVQRHYDKIVKHFNGYRHHLHNVVKDFNGKYRDEFIYEIIEGGR